jgi:hypothetical protein
MIYILLLFSLVLSLGAPPAETNARRWLRLLIAIPTCFAGVLVPLILFALSLMETPLWKGAARCGWVDGFHVGKVALTPVVLFATAALYGLEVMGADGRARWVILGFYCGAVTSVICQIFAFTCLDSRDLMPAMLVAVYIPIWYCVRAVQLGRRGNLAVLDYLSATLGMLPFWIGSWLWSRRVFDALPDVEPHPCFVVTAAGQGHPFLVGPFFEIEHDGARRRVNRQLEAFWRFEEDWRKRSPGTHGAFRKLYDRIGPRIAAHITSPWRADVVFLALKPIEYVARAVFRTIR